MSWMQAAFALELRRGIAFDASTDVQVVGRQLVRRLKPFALAPSDYPHCRADALVVDRNLSRSVHVLLRRRDVDVAHRVERRAFLRGDEPYLAGTETVSVPVLRSKKTSSRSCWDEA